MSLIKSCWFLDTKRPDIRDRHIGVKHRASNHTSKSVSHSSRYTTLSVQRVEKKMKLNEVEMQKLETLAVRGTCKAIL